MILLHILYLIFSVFTIRTYFPIHLMQDVIINATLVWISRKVFVQARNIYKLISNTNNNLIK